MGVIVSGTEISPYYKRKVNKLFKKKNIVDKDAYSVEQKFIMSALRGTRGMS